MKGSERAVLSGVMLLLLAWLLVGCSSTPKVDWNSRVGNYTHDQAVAEMGPPDKSARLSDGSTVAEWSSNTDQVSLLASAPASTAVAAVSEWASPSAPLLPANTCD